MQIAIYLPKWIFFLKRKTGFDKAEPGAVWINRSMLRTQIEGEKSDMNWLSKLYMFNYTITQGLFYQFRIIFFFSIS